MRNTRFVAAFFTFALPAIAVGQPIGTEFQVNSFVPGLQDDAAVSSDAAGNFVVVWNSDGQDGSGFGVFGQRYDLSGTPVGGEFPVNTFTDADQSLPAVASGDEGDFVVVWQSAGQDGSGLGVFGQRYDKFGIPQGAEFQVNTFTAGDQGDPDVASDADGNFVVLWESAGQDGSSRGVFGQRYDALGNALGGEFQVNTFTSGGQDDIAVASDAVGSFVVVWESVGQDGSQNGVYGQRYSASGTPIGSEFPVNTTTANDEENPHVDRNADGAFVVVWIADVQDGSGNGVFAQRFDASGNPVGVEFQVNSFTAGDQDSPSVALDADGNFMVVWQSNLQDGSGRGVFGQRYGESGNPLGGEFLVNTTTAFSQIHPTVAAARAPGGDFAVVWDSLQDLDVSRGIYGQRFLGAPGIVKRIAAGPDADGDQEIDVAVRIGQSVSTGYEFEIVYTNPQGPDVLIADAVPAEWDVLEVGGNVITNGFSAGDLPVPDGNPGAGTLSVFPANGKGNNKSATKISWMPDPANDRSTIDVFVESRAHKSSGPNRPPKFKPTECGPLFLNDAAFVFELAPDGTPLLPPIFDSNALLLVAVDDLNGGGIVGDGSGDEDGDGRSDLAEVRDAPFSDPCLADTDGDGVDDGGEVAQGTDPNSADTDADGVVDGADLCPLDDGGGFVDVDGCPI